MSYAENPYQAPSGDGLSKGTRGGAEKGTTWFIELPRRRGRPGDDGGLTSGLL